MLKGFDEQGLKDLCNRSTKGRCSHDNHKGSEEVKSRRVSVPSLSGCGRINILLLSSGVSRTRLTLGLALFTHSTLQHLS